MLEEEEAAAVVAGTPSKSSASLELSRQISITGCWLRMSIFLAACEIVPLFLFVAGDLPQVRVNYSPLAWIAIAIVRLGHLWRMDDALLHLGGHRDVPVRAGA